ncbi:MAG: type I glutamate--ammonia ligase [Deltaproteobacteria bacterium]|nr:type I glutamate--ammonia ligase [Deltaproteobacteria bacterium]
MNVSEVIAFAKENGAKMVDLKFLDFPGMWQHFGIPISHLDEGFFEDGHGFDGSSIRGWQPIHASDMLVIPDPSSARMDPFTRVPTLSLICNIVDPMTREAYTRDPRNIAQKAEKYVKSLGIADTIYFGPEAEFFVFDDVRYEQTANRGFYQVDSVEGTWNTARDEGPNLGYKPRHKEGYFPVAPTDSLDDLRTEMVLELEKLGMNVEAQHHEVATAGQCEIDMRYAPLVEMGDNLMWFKYVIKNVARRNNRTATFMPKPIFDDNGSGMHTHVSLWKDGTPLFAGDKYAGVSEMALHFIGGLLKHARAVCAFANASTNSYRRLVPGFEAPINLAYSSRNRSAAVRIPMYSSSPKAKRVEFRTPDPSCNPYLAFTAILMAGLDGIENRINPGDPLDKDIYALSPEELKDVPKTPFSLAEALEALRADHEFLLKGDVFTEDVVSTWLDYKMEREVKPMSLRPTPFEFELYYDL